MAGETTVPTQEARTGPVGLGAGLALNAVPRVSLIMLDVGSDRIGHHAGFGVPNGLNNMINRGNNTRFANRATIIEKAVNNPK